MPSSYTSTFSRQKSALASTFTPRPITPSIHCSSPCSTSLANIGSMIQSALNGSLRSSLGVEGCAVRHQEAAVNPLASVISIISNIDTLSPSRQHHSSHDTNSVRTICPSGVTSVPPLSQSHITPLKDYSDESLSNTGTPRDTHSAGKEEPDLINIQEPDLFNTEEPDLYHKEPYFDQATPPHSSIIPAPTSDSLASISLNQCKPKPVFHSLYSIASIGIHSFSTPMIINFNGHTISVRSPIPVLINGNTISVKIPFPVLNGHTTILVSLESSMGVEGWRARRHQAVSAKTHTQNHRNTRNFKSLSTPSISHESVSSSIHQSKLSAPNININESNLASININEPHLASASSHDSVLPSIYQSKNSAPNINSTNESHLASASSHDSISPSIYQSMTSASNICSTKEPSLISYRANISIHQSYQNSTKTFLKHYCTRPTTQEITAQITAAKEHRAISHIHEDQTKIRHTRRSNRSVQTCVSRGVLEDRHQIVPAIPTILPRLPRILPCLPRNLLTNHSLLQPQPPSPSIKQP
jgi:hypothetical protein